VKEFLVARPELLNRRGSFNRTLLWEAARKGRLEMVEWLLAQGADIDQTGAYNDETMVQVTPYVAAVCYRRPEVAAFLLAEGARLDIYRAAFLGRRDLVEHGFAARPELLRIEDPQDPIYHMPLLGFAVAGKHFELCQWLLELGAPVREYSWLLLYLAARVSRLDLVKLLLKNGAIAKAVDASIFLATRDTVILEYLLRHGASATREGLGRMTPMGLIHRADKGKRPEIARLLEKYGAKRHLIYEP
jgi:ankyrin repeat protein